MISTKDIETICKRIGKQVERSHKILIAVCERLREKPFVGGRAQFVSAFDEYKSNTIAAMVEILMRKGVIGTQRDGKRIVSYYLDEVTIQSMLAVSGPDPTRRSTDKLRGKCGHLAVELYDGICYGCHVANMINRQRKGKRKV